MVALAAAVSEEVLNRGLILSALGPTGVRSAVIISSLLFGLSHAFGLVFDPSAALAVAVQVAETAGHGSLWAAVRLRTGSIWPAVLGHFLLDLFDFSFGLRLGDLSSVAVGLRIGIAIVAVSLAIFLLRPNAHSSVRLETDARSSIG